MAKNKTFFQKLREDGMYFAGLILILVSFVTAWVPFFFSDESAYGIFIFNYGIALIYFILLWGTGRLRKGRNGLPPLFLLLVMSLISAYTLNREIQIFHVSTDWLSALLVISSVNYIAVFWYEKMPPWMKFIHIILLCVSLPLFVYLSIYLFPQYLVSAFFCWVLLLPMHSFVPLLITIYSIIWLLKITQHNRTLAITAWCTIGATVSLVAVFVATWITQVNAVNEEVNSKISIWPQYRIAYTDMTVTVRCGYSEARWTREEEAIYSFYLSEGSAVTALSLWIDGKESTGILTTKSKADSAYDTIVGREVRDPSVLHWQEGNRVSVRVFPVIPGKNRRFRVGVTSPLQMNKGKMEYHSVDIEGPSKATAKGPVNIEVLGTTGDLQVPAGFNAHNNQTYEPACLTINHSTVSFRACN